MKIAAIAGGAKRRREDIRGALGAAIARLERRACLRRLWPPNCS